MKKSFILISGLLLISTLGYAQQDKETKIKDQSLTISIAPAFFATRIGNLDANPFWPAGLYVTKNFIFKPRLGFSTGIHFLYKNIVTDGVIIDELSHGFSGITVTTNKYMIFDIPLRLNYYMIVPNDKFNFYFKAEINNSLIANYTKESPDNYGMFGSQIDYGYKMFLGIGLGLDFKVADRLSFIA